MNTPYEAEAKEFKDWCKSLGIKPSNAASLKEFLEYKKRGLKSGC